jgi:hypothetical protein
MTKFNSQAVGQLYPCSLSYGYRMRTSKAPTSSIPSVGRHTRPLSTSTQYQRRQQMDQD